MNAWHRARIAAIALLAICIWPTLKCYGLNRVRSICSLSPTVLSMPSANSAVAGEDTPQTADFLSSDPSGWVDMMPRKSFKGWTRMSVPPGKALDPVNQWKLSPDHRTVICEGNHGHEWLRYNHEYGNILVHVEWRFEKLEGPKGYNSGIFIRNDLTGRVWHQAQVGNHVYIFGQTLIHGELSPKIQTASPAVDPLHPIGEWNTYEIRCLGPDIDLWVNGEWAGHFSAPEVPRGYWGLEAEGYHIEFRNIKLKELK
jgi:hypothetical protein